MYRYQIVSLQYYNEDALSILLRYIPKREDHSPSPADHDSLPPDAFHIIAQLPIKGVVSLLPWDTAESHDLDGVDGILTQVLQLGPFKAGSLTVSGTRRLAAVVRIELNFPLADHHNL